MAAGGTREVSCGSWWCTPWGGNIQTLGGMSWDDYKLCYFVGYFFNLGVAPKNRFSEFPLKSVPYITLLVGVRVYSRRTLNLISCHWSHKNCNLGTPWNPYDFGETPSARKYHTIQQMTSQRNVGMRTTPPSREWSECCVQWHSAWPVWQRSGGAWVSVRETFNPTPGVHRAVNPKQLSQPWTVIVLNTKYTKHILQRDKW